MESKQNTAVSKYSGMKWCLVHIGNDITYGLAFVAGELLRMKHKIIWIDGDEKIESLNKKVKDFNPDYICFGPLSTEFSRSIESLLILEKDSFILYWSLWSIVLDYRYKSLIAELDHLHRYGVVQNQMHGLCQYFRLLLGGSSLM